MKKLLSIICIIIIGLFTIVVANAAEDKVVISYYSEGAQIQQQDKELFAEDFHLLDAPSPPNGMTFVEWNTQEDGLGDSYSAGQVFLLNDNTTLYAIWVKTVTKNSTSAIAMHYGARSSTEVPEFELKDEDGSYKNITPEETEINTYHWEIWSYEDGAFKKNVYSTNEWTCSVCGTTNITKYCTSCGEPSDVSYYKGYLVENIFTPMNKNGLKETIKTGNIETGYTTRSGYGFSANGYVNINKKNTGNLSGLLRASMLFPEYNYVTYYSENEGQFNDMYVSEEENGDITTYKYSLRESTFGNDDKDTEQVHYTPMWFPDSTSEQSYAPVTLITGLWTPVGEIRYTLKQEYNDNDYINLNTYQIKGSLFDDMYTTHAEYRNAE